jgi:hypothetical protein
MFIAAGVETEGENTLLVEAEKIGQKPGEEKTTTKANTEPVEGSYERFMATFSNPARWAGGR